MESILARVDQALGEESDGSVGKLLHDGGAAHDQALSLMRTAENSLRALIEQTSVLMVTNRRLEGILRTIDERGVLAALDGPEGELVARLDSILVSLTALPRT